MSISTLLAIASSKENFNTLDDYIAFCLRYLDFSTNGLQATIVSQNEPNYCFYQYRKDGQHNITRPINSSLMYPAAGADSIKNEFPRILDDVADLSPEDENARAVLQRAIYTIQQSIGATLDALPSGKSNTARKINGDLFERLMRLILVRIGMDCRSGTVRIPVLVNGKPEFEMTYQHDLLLFRESQLKIIGSVKTSSKDRLDKIFIDKFLYSRLTETDIPHIAIFLNDVQRKRTRKENQFGINPTFLPGHFKGYSVKLNPLDGVYYCDIRPNMSTDEFLKQHIKTIDCLLCDDLAGFMGKK